jgi:hypothetical protein
MSESLKPQPPEAAWLSVVKRHVNSLHFGIVQITVHNDRVVQIERTEKIRFDQPSQRDSLGENI